MVDEALYNYCIIQSPWVRGSGSREGPIRQNSENTKIL